ncbi:MAG: four helix bundle protein [Patescibacteria group bacterium]|nr:four helix bundle protein [Patescibacteria group bacterium]MDD4611112.1 four helix bundle protein [Patescibacteria group bacterium]
MTNCDYNLEERTARFSEEIIAFSRLLRKDLINNPLISQLIRSATSIGANYMEANGASSKKDFKNKIYICKKESRETKYWIQLIAKNNPEVVEKCRILWQEAQELTLIFSKITLTLEKKS